MRLGQRRRVVDAVARHRHDPAFALETLHGFSLLIRLHLRHDLVNPELPPHCLGSRAAIPSQHHDADAVFVQATDRLRRRRLDRVGHAEEPGEVAVNRHEHDGLAVRAQRLGRRGERTGIEMQLLEERAVAQGDHPAVHPAGDALPRVRGEVFRLGQLDLPLPRTCHDRRRERMLAPALQARGKTQQGGLVPAFSGHHRNDLGLSLGQRAGLVHDQRVHLAHDLDGLGVLEQHAGRRAFARSHHDGHRRRQAQRARTRDDQHSHGVDQGVGQAGLGADQCPYGERDDGRGHDRRDEVAGHHVRQLLDRRTGALGLRDHMHDLGEQRLGAHALSAHH